MAVDELAAAAALRGASGVQMYLQETRKSLHELLLALASPSLVGSASPSDAASPPEVGLRIETLPLRVQRELWSAFVKWQAGLLPADAMHELVSRFLSVAQKPPTRSYHSPHDAACVRLATLLSDNLKQRASCDQSDDDEEAWHTVDDREHGDAVNEKLKTLVFLPTIVLPPRENCNGSVAQTNKKRRRASEEEISSSTAKGEPSRANGPVTTAALSPEAETRVAAIASELARLGSADVTADQTAKASELATLAVAMLQQVMNEVHATQHDNAALFETVCAKLQLSATSDEALFQITSGLMGVNWSSRYAAIYLGATVLPRVLRATSVISRVLVQTTLLYAKPTYATAIVDGLLVPVLTAPGIGLSQSEAVNRFLRDKCIPVDQFDAFLSRALAINSRSILTSEPAVLVFQTVFNMKAALSAPTIERLVGAMCSALELEPTRDSLRKSAKFSTLVFTLVSKYSAQCGAHAEELNGVASQLTSPLAKPTMRAIQKLKS